MVQIAAKPSSWKLTTEITRKAILYLILSAGAVTMLVPFLWMISTSLKASNILFQVPPEWIPKPLMWSNYAETWSRMPFGRLYLNSIFVAVTVTLGRTFTSAMAGYAFARLEFPGRDKLFITYLSVLMIPVVVTMIPRFILFRMLGWLDTYQVLIVPSVFTAFGTFLMRQFFMSIPRDLEDAAEIDGCGAWRTFVIVAMPLSKPALATLAIFSFLGSWNEFMWPLIVINTLERMTLPIALRAFLGWQTDGQVSWGLLMAASVIVLGPPLIVFIAAQKYFVQGIALTGIKG
jgi:multiple sugar transport system permease protein